MATVVRPASLALLALSWALPTAAESSFSIAAYLPDYYIGAVDDSDWLGFVDELVLFSATPRADGGVDLPTALADRLPPIVRTAAEHGVDVLLAVGGGGRSAHFPAIAADPTLRRTLAVNLASLVADHDLAGILVDWEVPTSAGELAHLGDVLTILYRALAKVPGREKRPLLGVTVHAAILSRAGPSGNLDQAGAWARRADRVHVMAYDVASDPHGHSTEAVAELHLGTVLAAGIPQGKVVLGLPLYGRHRTTGDAKAYRDLVPAPGPTPGPEVNEVAGYRFNGPALLRRKVALAKSLGLGGVFIWSLGQDRSEAKGEGGSLVAAVAAEGRAEATTAAGRKDEV